VFFAFFSSSLAKKSENYIEQSGESTDVWDKYLIMFVTFFTVIAAIRCDVGSDNLSYAVIFDRVHVDHNGREELWKLFVDTVQHLGLHWTFGLGICGFIQIFFITKALKPYRWLLVFVPLVFFGGRYWMDCMNAVRQMMAASIFLWASRFIYDRKRIKYLIVIFICSLIHNSAVLLLPLVFLPLTISIERHRWTLLAIFLSCFVIGQTPAFQSLAGVVQSVAVSTDYEVYATSMSSALQSGNDDEALAYGPMMLSYLLISIFIIWYGPELKAKYEDKIPYFSLWYNLSYFYACAYFFVCNLGHIFIRPLQYFSLFQMVIAALLLRYLWTEYRTYGVRPLAALFFCIVIATNTAWAVTKASNLGYIRECSTYKTIFFNKDILKTLGLKCW
jgi:hypothetical protein